MKKKLHKKLLLSLLLIAAATLAVYITLSRYGSSENFEKIYFLHSSGSKTPLITAKLAQTEAERRKGLMYVTQLPEDQGMFFSFSEETTRSFWMKNTYISLDIIFISKEKTVVHIASKTTPFSEKSISSEKPAMYVLEIPGGMAEKYSITLGSRLILTQ